MWKQCFKCLTWISLNSKLSRLWPWTSHPPKTSSWWLNQQQGVVLVFSDAIVIVVCIEDNTLLLLLIAHVWLSACSSSSWLPASSLGFLISSMSKYVIHGFVGWFSCWLIIMMSSLFYYWHPLCEFLIIVFFWLFWHFVSKHVHTQCCISKSVCWIHVSVCVWVLNARHDTVSLPWHDMQFFTYSGICIIIQSTFLHASSQCWYSAFSSAWS